MVDYSRSTLGVPSICLIVYIYMWRLQPKSLGNIFCQKGRYNNHQDTKIRWWWNHGGFFHTATFFNVAGCFQFKITSAGSLDIWSQVLLGLDEFGRWFFILFNPCICFLILYTIIFLHEKTMRSWVVKVVWIYIYIWYIMIYVFTLCLFTYCLSQKESCVGGFFTQLNKSDLFIDLFCLGNDSIQRKYSRPGPQKTYHTPLTPKVSMGLSAHEVQFHGCCTNGWTFLCTYEVELIFRALPPSPSLKYLWPRSLNLYIPKGRWVFTKVLVEVLRWKTKMWSLDIGSNEKKAYLSKSLANHQVVSICRPSAGGTGEIRG